MKRLAKIFLVLVLCLALTGCVKMDMAMSVKEDGTMDVAITYLMSESVLSATGTSAEDMASSISQQYGVDQTNVKVENITKTIDGQTYQGVKIAATSTAEEAKALLSIKDGVYSLTIPAKSFDVSSLTDSTGYSMDQLAEAGVEMKATITMPGNASSTFGTVSGNTVVIDMLKITSSTGDIVVTSSAGGTNIWLWVGVGAGILILLAVVILLVVKSKKKVSQPEETESVPELTPPSDVASEETVTQPEAPQVADDSSDAVPSEDIADKPVDEDASGKE